jgi:hypothetical protein
MPPGVFTRSYGSARTGANTHETMLTPANVGHLRKRFSGTVTGELADAWQKGVPSARHRSSHIVEES